jgi:hypothetical protein
MALQALSEFARMAYSNNFNIDVSVTAGAFHQQFSVNQGNALVLQSADVSIVIEIRCQFITKIHCCRILQ